METDKKHLGIRRRTLVFAAGGMGAAAGTQAQLAQLAQGPQGPHVVKIIVGFPAAQATDVVARLLADKLPAVTGGNYIVDNRPGRGGSLAMGALARSPADGSVMMLAHMSAVATNPHMYKSVPYDPLKDFEAVGLLADLPFVLVCHPSMPFNTIEQLVRYAKENPGKLTNASSGNGTVSHLAMEDFKARAGIDILHVPYKGSGPGLADVVAGQVSLALETAAAVQPFIQSGRLKALGTGTTKRLSTMPNVVPIAEQGFEGFSAVTWLMLLYPAGTDKHLVSNTFAAMNKALQTPEVDARMRQIGVIPRFSASTAEAAAFIGSEYAHWGEVVRRSGVRLD
ncbi:Tripartite-type tricarboxylate transporter, receptor component TctC [Variovorax sp. HW608]|uniref:Bug family tripartite tricarboxylate transporter substrate binding protein n=1 Tax=Variovorax sp. HW608 TaxID=1034889 RepID=UPI00081FFAD9|nr:tripartite tricarboxylate transporter substrate-binding protein [Variovorax sp. HW608]SCK14438.1 Tripartite-type tricarboxylate transporter, receptor component TctC [Variovorax sp. HW608]